MKIYVLSSSATDSSMSLTLHRPAVFKNLDDAKNQLTEETNEIPKASPNTTVNIYLDPIGLDSSLKITADVYDDDGEVYSSWRVDEIEF